MNTPSQEASRGWSPVLIGSVIVGIVLLLLLIPTFRTPEPQGNSGENGEGGEEDVSGSQCERTLMSAMDGLQPNRLGISSETRVMVDTLNNWMSQCVDQTTEVVDQADPQLREQLLTAEGFDHSQSGRFQLRDAEHIRNTLLAADIVERLTAELRSDSERALALFYYVVRTLDLLPEDTPDLRLTPYESLVYGIGTAADRGWTYALLMRQLRLDVVMIQPRGPEESTYWLLGAVIPGEGVLLLDPRMGLPLSPTADLANPQSPLPEQAATLTEVRQNDQVLRQYDQTDRKYPLTTEDLATVDVYAIGTSSTFAPRIARLQAALPEAGELFDGLASNDLREVGLVDRLVAAGADGLWSREQVHVWPYPERFWSETGEPTEEQQQRLENMHAVLSGPRTIAITVSVNEQDELQLGTTTQKPQRTLLEVRIEQLLGNFAAAQQAYLQARLNRVDMGEVRTYFSAVEQTLAEQIENPQEAQQTYLAIEQQVMQQINGLISNVPEMQLNALAGDMATYWAAQAQYEQQDYQVAAESALAYVKRGGGNFLMSAIYLASLSLAQDGRPEEAVDLADQRPAQAAPAPGYLALVDRWRKLSSNQQDADKPSTETDAETSPPDATSQPAADSDKAPADDTPEPARSEPTDSKPSPPEEDSQAEPPPASDGEDEPAEDAAESGPAEEGTADNTDDSAAADGSGIRDESPSAGESDTSDSQSSAGRS